MAEERSRHDTLLAPLSCSLRVQGLVEDFCAGWCVVRGSHGHAGPPALIPPWERLRTGAGTPPRKLSPSLGSNGTDPHRARSPSASLAASSNQGYLLTPRPQRWRGTVLVGFPELLGLASSPRDPLFPPARPRPALLPAAPPRAQPHACSPASAGPRSSRSPPAPPATAGAPAPEDRGKSKRPQIEGGEKLSCLFHITPSLLPSSARWEGWLLPARRGAQFGAGQPPALLWRGGPRATATGRPRRQQGGHRGRALQPRGACLRLAPKEKRETKHRKGKGRKSGK